MTSSLKSCESKAEKIPAVLLLAESVEPVAVAGEFDAELQTWSNRDYECASTKKHNEAM